MGATKQERAWDQQTTTAGLVDLGPSNWDIKQVSHVGLGVEEVGGAQSINYTVLGSYDGGATFPVILQAVTLIALSARDDIEIDVRAFSNIKIQIQDGSGNGEVTAQAVGYQEA